MNDKTPDYIQLGSNFYEVRRNGETREVRTGETWIPAIDFPNWLIRENRHDEWEQLVIYGATKQVKP